MNLSTILADVYRRCGYASSPDSSVTTRLTAFINETQQEIFSKPGMDMLFNDQITLDSVANQSEYGLPETVQKIRTITDATNRWKLEPMGLPEYRYRFPDPTSDIGTPAFYVPAGRSVITIAPTMLLGQLNVISTSASDTGTAYLEGFRASVPDFPFSTSVVMTGTTQALLGASDLTKVTKFWISTAAIGEVRLRNATPTIIAHIAPGYTATHTNSVILAPTPSSAIRYNIDFERTLTDMTIGADEPLLPFKFHRLLAIGARMKEYEKQAQMDRYTAANAEMIRGLRELKYWMADMAGSPNLRSYMARSRGNSAVNVTTS